MKKYFSIVIALVLFIGLALFIGCSSDSSVASKNLSTKADMFELYRRVVFYNGITDTYMLTVEGRLSINYDGMDKQLEVTIKTGPSSFKKHYLGLSDNVTYFSEQLEDAEVDVYNYRVIFKPQSIIPNVDLIIKSPESVPGEQ